MAQARLSGLRHAARHCSHSHCFFAPPGADCGPRSRPSSASLRHLRAYVAPDACALSFHAAYALLIPSTFARSIPGSGSRLASFS